MDRRLHAKRMLAARRMRSPLVWSGGFSIFLFPTHRTEWPTPAWSGGSRERIAMRKIVKPIPASRSASTASAKRPRAALLAAFARYMRPANRARERSRYLALIALRRPAGYDFRLRSGVKFLLERVKHGRKGRFFTCPEREISRALAHQHAQAGDGLGAAGAGLAQERRPFGVEHHV